MSGVEWFYSAHNKIPTLNGHERRLLETALQEKLPLHEAYRRFNSVTLYKLYKTHVACRPTLKRLAALALLDMEKDGFSLDSQEVPATLLEEVRLYGRHLRVVQLSKESRVTLEFRPPVVNPQDVVGKEMVLFSINNHVKAYFKSITPNWDVELRLYSRLLGADDVMKVKIVFLDVCRKGAFIHYVFDFHRITQPYDFSRVY